MWANEQDILYKNENEVVDMEDYIIRKSRRRQGCSGFDEQCGACMSNKDCEFSPCYACDEPYDDDDADIEKELAKIPFSLFPNADTKQDIEMQMEENLG